MTSRRFLIVAAAGAAVGHNNESMLKTLGAVQNVVEVHVRAKSHSGVSGSRVYQTAVGDKNGLWTTVIAAAVLVG